MCCDDEDAGEHGLTQNEFLNLRSLLGVAVLQPDLSDGALVLSANVAHVSEPFLSFPILSLVRSWAETLEEIEEPDELMKLMGLLGKAQAIVGEYIRGDDDPSSAMIFVRPERSAL